MACDDRLLDELLEDSPDSQPTTIIREQKYYRIVFRYRVNGGRLRQSTRYAWGMTEDIALTKAWLSLSDEITRRTISPNTPVVIVDPVSVKAQEQEE